MPGCSRLAAASASTLEPLDLLLVGQFAGEDHLHRDDAVEADLTRLVDHPHAAAGDFFQ